jgi:hypothetical protein
MDLEDITYSREATIAAVTDYYTFLTRMYLNKSDITYPPSGGWPSIVNRQSRRGAIPGQVGRSPGAAGPPALHPTPLSRARRSCP